MNNLFTGKQILLFVAGCSVLIMGYILLAQGPVDNPLSLSWAPFLLIGGYCVLIPVAIILKDNKQKKTK
jgi:uncharacterized membrane protein YbhN (UPF0104 family)